MFAAGRKPKSRTMRSALLRRGSFATFMLLLSQPADALAVSPSCDRTCLSHLAERYLDALAGHRPQSLPLARDIRFSENGVALSIGDALWATVSSIANRGSIAIDPAAHSVALLATVREGSRPALLAARITARGKQIAAIETVVVRRETATFLSADGFARPVDAKPLPSPAPRAQLRDAAARYFAALVQPGELIPPFDATCERVENGVRTTNNPDPLPGVSPSPLNPAMTSLGCGEQFKRGRLRFVSKVRELRYPVIDTANGVVAAFGMFDHDGRQHGVAAGQAVSNTLQSPFSFAIAEFFVIRDGKIKHIEAALSQVPIGLKAPWQP